jgi:glycosyltransferase involved in cell wall biosynthesis
MKIAQVAPLMESVPPRLYGGTERIVSYLTEELVRLGHDVTLFASGDSITSAELAPCCTRALRLDPTVRDTIPYFMVMIDKVRERAVEFDVLHFHVDLFHFPLFRALAARTLTTLHGRQDLADLKRFYARFGEKCHWFPSRTTNANRHRTPILLRRSTTAFRSTCIGRHLSREATSPSWGGFRRKSARTAQSG